MYTRNLWMCWKSRRWWAQHASHFQLPIRSYWESAATQPITDAVHILKLVRQWSGQKVSEQEASGRDCKKFWTLVRPRHSCQFEILRPHLFFYLSLLSSLLLSLFLYSSQSVAFSCLVSLSCAQLAISSLLEVPKVYCS
jgi:hypothetical protein